MAWSAVRLARVLEARSQYADAERLALSALPIAQNKLNPRPQLEAETYHVLARILSHDSARYQEASNDFDKALSVYSGTYGPESPVMGGLLQDLGLLLIQFGKQPQGNEMLNRAKEIRAKYEMAGAPVIP